MISHDGTPLFSFKPSLKSLVVDILQQVLSQVGKRHYLATNIVSSLQASLRLIWLAHPWFPSDVISGNCHCIHAIHLSLSSLLYRTSIFVSSDVYSLLHVPPTAPSVLFSHSISSLIDSYALPCQVFSRAKPLATSNTKTTVFQNENKTTKHKNAVHNRQKLRVFVC